MKTLSNVLIQSIRGSNFHDFNTLRIFLSKFFYCFWRLYISYDPSLLSIYYVLSKCLTVCAIFYKFFQDFERDLKLYHLRNQRIEHKRTKSRILLYTFPSFSAQVSKLGFLSYLSLLLHKINQRCCYAKFLTMQAIISVYL